MKLTNRGKALIAFVVIFAIAWLGYTVTTTAAPSKCETLYNQYSNSVLVAQRNHYFQKGIDNGCFHYN